MLQLVLFFFCQFGFGQMFPGQEAARGQFESTYRAYSVSMLPGQERTDVEKGGKSKYMLQCKKWCDFH